VSPPAFRLAVEQRLADGAYIYTEGAWSFVEIRTAAGSAVAAADAPFDTRLDLLVTDIPAGSYVVASWQRGNQADGSPGSEIMDQCERELELVGTAQVLIVVNPGTGCAISTQVAGGAGPATASSPPPQPPSSASAEAALGSDDRVQIYATLVRHFAGVEQQQWTEIVVLSQLCDQAGHPVGAPDTCPDRLTDEEQSQLASQLVDLAPLVRFVDDKTLNQFQIEWTETEPHLLVRLGPIEAANGQVHVGADMACGGTCGVGAEFTLERVSAGWEVTNTMGVFVA
jgi:hypothetical protein